MLLKIIDQFHREIRLTRERLEHIVERKEMVSALKRIEETILIPEIIKQSKHDKNVWLYYRFFDKTPVSRKYLAVIIRVLNGEAFIITSYYTDRVKEGKTIWKR